MSRMPNFFTSDYTSFNEMKTTNHLWYFWLLDTTDTGDTGSLGQLNKIGKFSKLTFKGFNTLRKIQVR